VIKSHSAQGLNCGLSGGVFAVADGSLNSFVGRVSISFGTPVRYVSTGLTRCAPNLQLSFVGCPIADGIR
jgi:hypothetical protein